MNSQHKLDIAIIIPIYNESENIPRLLTSLNKYISSLKKIKTEVIFVDDGSTDNSYNLLKIAIHQTYSAKIIKLSKNFGSHAAFRAGIYYTNSNYTTFLNADLQNPIKIVGKLYNRCQEGFDIVIATRKKVTKDWWNRIWSFTYVKLIRTYIFPNFPDNNFDMVMFNQKIKKQLNENMETNSSIFLQIINLGFKQTTVDYSCKNRVLGRSKWTFSKKVKLFIDSFIGFSYTPIRLISIMGILFSFLGIFWALYIIFRAIFIKDLKSGWPSLISIILFGFGITNISLSIVAEYLWRIFDVSRNKRPFLIDEVVFLGKKYDK